MKSQVHAACLSDAGCVRDSNEDAARIHESADDARGVLAVVADGMGGHMAGEVASHLAVETIHDVYFQHPGAPGEALQAAFAAANHVIYERAQQNRLCAGMGTTCVAVAVCEGQAYASHVGDSRLYLVRRGQIYQLTNDDSVVSEMVSRGVISRDDARRHADRNVILKALGTRADVVASSWSEPLPIQPGDTLVLCSDGLTDMVSDGELASTAADGPVAEGCRALVGLAKSRGGFDNITVALLRFTPSQSASTSLRETRDVRVTS